VLPPSAAAADVASRQRRARDQLGACDGVAQRPRKRMGVQRSGSAGESMARPRKRSAAEVASAAAKMRVATATEMRMAAAVAASMTTSAVAASAMPAAASRDGIASGQRRHQNDGGNPDIEL